MKTVKNQVQKIKSGKTSQEKLRCVRFGLCVRTTQTSEYTSLKMRGILIDSPFFQLWIIFFTVYWIHFLYSEQLKMYGFLVPVGGGDPISIRKNEVLIGRREDCDVVLRFSNVSGQHCKLVLSSGYWYVLDQNSTNGVKVNGRKVTDHRVDPGAILAISKHLFTLQYNPTENGATASPPSEVYRESEVTSRSLMEKAGLSKPTAKTVYDSGSTIPDKPIIIESGLRPQMQSGKKIDFFSQLQFD
ncbi:MAG: FHA domain-containing protein [Thermoguttaceae bacterium]